MSVGAMWRIRDMFEKEYFYPKKVYAHKCLLCLATNDVVSSPTHSRIKNGLIRHYCRKCRSAIHFGCRKHSKTSLHNICKECGVKFYYNQSKAGVKPDLCRKCQIKARIKLRIRK